MSGPNTATIRTATHHDSTDLAEVLADAFLYGDLGPWLVPHVETRARVYRPYFALMVEQALDHGHVEVADGSGGLTAVAIWYAIADDLPPAPIGYPMRLAQITGQFLHRFTDLDDAVHRHHPFEAWHHYLAYLAVRPDLQGCGLGSLLLEHHHRELDASGTPAYLEATGSRNVRLYGRHGYRPRHMYRLGTEAPALYPMWRPAIATPVAADNGTSPASGENAQ